MISYGIGVRNRGFTCFVDTKWGFLGWAGILFVTTLMPFSLPSFFFSSLDLTLSKNSLRQLLGLMCSIRTFSILARILPLTTLLTRTPTASLVTPCFLNWRENMYRVPRR